MSKIIFILGGARSGKSGFAMRLAEKHEKVAYLATGVPCDGEMKERIRRHKEERPAGWVTFEEQVCLAPVIKNRLSGFAAALIDCVGGWVTNMLLQKPSCKEEAIIDQTRVLLKTARAQKKLECIFVSNEVGLGLVPATPLGRECRDILGRVNQLIAAEADEVYFMVAGIAQKIK